MFKLDNGPGGGSFWTALGVGAILFFGAISGVVSHLVS